MKPTEAEYLEGQPNADRTIELATRLNEVFADFEDVPDLVVGTVATAAAVAHTVGTLSRAEFGALVDVLWRQAEQQRTKGGISGG